MKPPRIVGTTENYVIQPSDINADKHLFEAFDNTETEISAGWLVRFAQQRNEGWKPFLREEIEAFYAQKFSHGFRFNRLVEPQMVPPSLARAFAGHHDTPIPRGGGWIVEKEGKFHFTTDFIERCYRTNPARELTSK